MFHQILCFLSVVFALFGGNFISAASSASASASSATKHPPIYLPICPFEYRHLKREIFAKGIDPKEKASWFKDSKAKEIISNHRYLYFGTTDELGRRSGRGFLVNHLNGDIYLGAMCNNMFHYYGIQLQPSEHAPGYRAYAYYWNQGIPSIRAAIPKHLKDLLKRLANCKQMYYLLANMLQHMPKANCQPFSGCKDGTEGKPTLTDYAAPSVRAVKPHGNELANGSCISHNTLQEKSVEGFSPKYSHSSLYLLRGKASGIFGLHLFSLDPQYHPRAKLYAKNSDKTWTPVQFDLEGDKSCFSMVENQDYLLEIGVNLNPSEGQLAFEFGNKNKGPFACLFSETLTKKLPSLIGGAIYHEKGTTFDYSVSVMKGDIQTPGQFTQTTKDSRSFQVGTMNRAITPYYSTSSQTITIYYTGGDSEHCGRARKGELVISKGKANEEPKLSVTEPSNCSYVGKVNIPSLGQLFDELEKAKDKMMPLEVK